MKWISLRRIANPQLSASGRFAARLQIRTSVGDGHVERSGPSHGRSATVTLSGAVRRTVEGRPLRFDRATDRSAQRDRLFLVFLLLLSFFSANGQKAPSPLERSTQWIKQGETHLNGGDYTRAYSAFQLAKSLGAQGMSVRMAEAQRRNLESIRRAARQLTFQAALQEAQTLSKTDLTQSLRLLQWADRTLADTGVAATSRADQAAVLRAVTTAVVGSEQPLYLDTVGVGRGNLTVRLPFQASPGGRFVVFNRALWQNAFEGRGLKRVHSFADPRGQGYAVFSADNRFLLWVQPEGKADTLWALGDRQRAEPVHVFTHAPYQQAPVFSPDGQFLLTQTRESRTLWRLDDDYLRRPPVRVVLPPLLAEKAQIDAQFALFSPDSRHLVLSASPPPSSAPRMMLGGGVFFLADGRGGSGAYTAGPNLALWPEYDVRKPWQGFNPRETLPSRAYALRLPGADSTGGPAIHPLDTLGQLAAARFSPDGRHLIGLTGWGGLRLWSVTAPGFPLSDSLGASAGILDVTVKNDLLVARLETGVRVYRIRAGKLVMGGEVRGEALKGGEEFYHETSENGRFLLTYALLRDGVSEKSETQPGQAGWPTLWKVEETGLSRFHQFSRPFAIRGPHFSPQGRYLVAGLSGSAPDSLWELTETGLRGIHAFKGKLGQLALGSLGVWFSENDDDLLTHFQDSQRDAVWALTPGGLQPRLTLSGTVQDAVLDLAHEVLVSRESPWGELPSSDSYFALRPLGAQQQLVPAPQYFREPCTLARFSGNGTLLVTQFRSGTPALVIWNEQPLPQVWRSLVPQQFSPIDTLHLDAEAVVVSHSGDYLLIRPKTGPSELWKRQDERFVRQVVFEKRNSEAVFSAGQEARSHATPGQVRSLLLLGWEGGGGRLIELSSGGLQVRHEFPAAWRFRPGGLRFSPQDPRYVVIDYDSADVAVTGLFATWAIDRPLRLGAPVVTGSTAAFAPLGHGLAVYTEAPEYRQRAVRFVDVYRAFPRPPDPNFDSLRDRLAAAYRENRNPNVSFFELWNRFRADSIFPARITPPGPGALALLARFRQKPDYDSLPPIRRLEWIDRYGYPDRPLLVYSGADTYGVELGSPGQPVRQLARGTLTSPLIGLRNGLFFTTFSATAQQTSLIAYDTALNEQVMNTDVGPYFDLAPGQSGNELLLVKPTGIVRYPTPEAVLANVWRLAPLNRGLRGKYTVK